MWEARLTRKDFLSGLARNAVAVSAALLVPLPGGIASAKAPEAPLVGEPKYGDRVAALFARATVRSL